VTVLEHDPARSRGLCGARDAAQVPHVGHPVERHEEARRRRGQERLELLLGERVRERMELLARRSRAALDGSLGEDRLEFAARRAAVAVGEEHRVNPAPARPQRLDHWSGAFDQS